MATALAVRELRVPTGQLAVALQRPCIWAPRVRRQQSLQSLERVGVLRRGVRHGVATQARPMVQHLRGRARTREEEARSRGLGPIILLCSRTQAMLPVQVALAIQAVGAAPSRERRVLQAAPHRVLAAGGVVLQTPRRSRQEGGAARGGLVGEGDHAAICRFRVAGGAARVTPTRGWSPLPLCRLWAATLQAAVREPAVP